MSDSLQRRWRIASANGFLLGCYLVPAWSAAVWKIWAAPVRGLFDTANLAPAVFASDFLHLVPVNMMRFALLLALVKLTVIVFFVAFVCFTLSSVPHERKEADELLHVGLTLAAIVSTLSMALAYWVGEGDALRLHATETLMILSAAIVALVDEPTPDAEEAVDVVAVRIEQVGAPASEKIAA